MLNILQARLCYCNLYPVRGRKQTAQNTAILHVHCNLYPVRGRKHTDEKFAQEENKYCNLSPQGDGNAAVANATAGNSHIAIYTPQGDGNLGQSDVHVISPHCNLYPARGRKHFSVLLIILCPRLQFIPRKGTETCRCRRGSLGARLQFIPRKGTETRWRNLRHSPKNIAIYTP